MVDRTRGVTGDVLEDVVARTMMCGGGFVDDFWWWSGDDVFLPIESAKLSGPWLLVALVKEPLVLLFFPVVVVVVGGVVVVAAVVVEIVDVVILVIVVAPALIFFCHWEVVSSQELSASRDGTCNDT